MCSYFAMVGDMITSSELAEALTAIQAELTDSDAVELAEAADLVSDDPCRVCLRHPGFVSHASFEPCRKCLLEQERAERHRLYPSPF